MQIKRLCLRCLIATLLPLPLFSCGGGGGGTRHVSCATGQHELCGGSGYLGLGQTTCTCITDARFLGAWRGTWSDAAHQQTGTLSFVLKNDMGGGVGQGVLNGQITNAPTSPGQTVAVAGGSTGDTLHFIPSNAQVPYHNNVPSGNVVGDQYIQYSGVVTQSASGHLTGSFTITRYTYQETPAPIVGAVPASNFVGTSLTTITFDMTLQ